MDDHDYERCKCNKHPATHQDEFDLIIWEYGSLDKLLFQEIEATCKICKEKFKFTKCE